MSGEGSPLDRDVRELLRDEPELLALAETIASMRPRGSASASDAGGSRRPRLTRLRRALRAARGRPHE